MKLLERLATRRMAIGLGLVLALPSLFLGYFADDFILLHDLKSRGGGLGAAVQLYQFSRGWVQPPGEPKTWLPWFASPSYRTDFVRPLAGVLFWLDEQLSPRGGIVAHVHSLLWWLLLLVVVAALLKRLLPAPIAGLALLLFAVDDGHWQPISWLANRHALVGATLVFAGILAHLRWRDDKWRAGLPLSLAAFAAGLCAGEAALQALAYLYGLELLSRRRGWLLRLAPATVVVFTYGAVRQILGAGIVGSGLYFDPMRQPLRFLLALPARLAILLGDILGGVPSDFYFAFPRAEPWLIASGAVVVAVVGWLGWQAFYRLAPEERVAVAGLLVGGFLAVVPGAAGIPGSRLLLAPSLAGAVLIATIVVRLPVAPLLRGCLVVVHLLWAPLQLVLNQGIALGAAQRSLDAVTHSDLDGDVVVVTVPDPFVAIYPTYLEAAQRTPRFRSYQVLAFTPLDLTLTRTGPQDLRLDSLRGRFFESPVEALLSEHPLPIGATVEQGRLTARVVSATRLELHFAEPLEGLNLVVWRDGALRHLTLPAVGEQVTIRRERGMMGF